MKIIMILAISLGLVACANPTTTGDGDWVSGNVNLSTNSKFATIILRNTEIGYKYEVIQKLRKN